MLALCGVWLLLAAGEPASWVYADEDDGFTATVPPIGVTQADGIDVQKAATPSKVNPSGAVTYSYSVQNHELNALSDVTVVDDGCAPVKDSNGNEAAAQTLDALEERVYTCVTSLTVDTLNTVTVTALSPVNGPVIATDTAFVDVLPTVSLAKTVTPASRPEPGGVFTFTLTITNTSTEPVRLTQLTDDYPLSAACLALINSEMAAGDVAQCRYTVTRSQPGDYANTAKVTVREIEQNHPSDEDHEASDSASASFTVIDLPSSLVATKSARPSALPAPGGPVTFTLRITNTSPIDSVTLNTIAVDDNNDGVNNISFNAGNRCNATALTPGAAAVCTYVRTVAGAPGAAITSKATISGVDDDGDSVSASATTTVYLLAGPVLTAAKLPHMDTVDEPGGPIIFDVVVTNNHPAATVMLTELSDSHFGNVTDAEHDDLITTGCSVVAVPPLGEFQCQFEATIAGNAGDLHTNTLAVAGVDADGGVYRAQAAAQVDFANVPSSIAVTKTPDPVSVPEEGGPVTFTVSVMNTSPADEVTVESIVDSAYGDVTAADNPALTATTCATGATIPVGATFACHFTAFVTGAVGSQHTNTVTVAMIDDDGDQASASASATVPIIGALPTATKRAALVADFNQDGVANPGDIIGYTVVITNVGNNGGSFTFTDAVDINTTLIPSSIAANPGVMTSSAAGFTVNQINLGAGEVGTIRFHARVNNPLPAGVTQVANQGVVSAPNAPTVVTDDPTTSAMGDATVTLVVASPLLAVTKSDALAVDRDQDGLVSPGDDLEYAITVRNTGNQAAANLMIDDTPDGNSTLVVGSVVAGPNAQVVTGNNTGDTKVRVALNSPLAVGDAVAVTFRVRVNAPLPLDVTELRNQALVTGSNVAPTPSDDPATPAPGDATVTPVTALPKVALFKRASLLVDADDDGVPSPGDSLVYHLSILNRGNQEAIDLVLTDTPDPNTSLVTGSVQRSQGAVIMGNGPGDERVEIALGAMAPGAAATVTFQVMIGDPLPQGVFQVSNQATVSGANIDDTLSDDPTTDAVGDATRTTVTATPVLLVTKRDFLFVDADGDDEAGPGDTLLYNVRIVNQGNAAAADVRFIDAPDPQTALEPNSILVIPAAGEVVTGNSRDDQQIEIELGEIPPNGVVNIGFRVTVLPGAAVMAVNQATVEYVNPNELGARVNTVRSDDPDTDTPNDPTTTPLMGVETPNRPLLLPLIYAGAQ
ncbi:MAG: DUF11 domain-containing protein [Caldilineaceae bacterium]|nr:DUF11 domain-containing protein [Caldilineaceae bacterium]